MTEHKNLLQVGGLLDSKGYGIATRPGTPFKPLLDQAILKLMEGGTLHRLRVKWWKQKRGGGACDAKVRFIHRKKKVREFPVPSRDVTTKLSLGGNNDVITELFLPRGSLICDIPAGDGKLVNLFLRCRKPLTINVTFFALLNSSIFSATELYILILHRTMDITYLAVTAVSSFSCQQLVTCNFLTIMHSPIQKVVMVSRTGSRVSMAGAQLNHIMLLTPSTHLSPSPALTSAIEKSRLK